MLPVIAGLVAAGLSAVVLHQRRRRRVAERLSAATLETLLNAVDANDRVTGAHVRRVAAVALVLADAAGLDEHERSNVERVALFHDIGKIHEALFDILHDAAQLTPEERRAVATHPDRGGEVLAPLDAFYPALRDGVVAHHERWDGTGYPRGLKGRSIPLVARIVSIADAFDAITHSRRYSTAKSEKAAIEALRDGRGTQFDPELIDLLLAPPVLDEVRKARQRALRRPSRGTRRRQKPASDAPDIRFRWRTPELWRTARGSERRR
jgi:HD-GYP domain-containing protein (c-di-GMP phosphodiesterase class II)